MYFQNKINYALALSGRLGEYHIRTQGVALGYMIKGFQPTGWYDKYSTVWHHSKCRMNLKLLRFLGS